MPNDNNKSNRLSFEAFLCKLSVSNLKRASPFNSIGFVYINCSVLGARSWYEDNITHFRTTKLIHSDDGAFCSGAFQDSICRRFHCVCVCETLIVRL